MAEDEQKLTRQTQEDRRVHCTVYIDIESLGLRDFIRVIMLKDIRTAALEAEKPVVLCTNTPFADGNAQTERNLPYHFLAELNDYSRSDEEQDNEGDKAAVHLGLLIRYMEEVYWWHLKVTHFSLETLENI
ncbi:hypothetical protein ACO22_03091 [Paracoccidioides brasiliensis]|uniref:Uncharacterized protein n=1 Tax=Paracoccidioides brasiliensis TaxID=121759 RepID=A0A1D2JGV4_PARBR|nr:hypothetical protein ACO22_03091 [Paracoccidioides brasiliensis]